MTRNFCIIIRCKFSDYLTIRYICLIDVMKRNCANCLYRLFRQFAIIEVYLRKRTRKFLLHIYVHTYTHTYIYIIFRSLFLYITVQTYPGNKYAVRARLFMQTNIRQWRRRRPLHSHVLLSRNSPVLTTYSFSLGSKPGTYSTL